MNRARVGRSLLALATTAMIGTGCAAGDEEEPKAAAAPRADTTRTVERTRVQVVEGLGKSGAFDPAAIYERLSPGVITVISQFEGEGGGSGGLLGQGQEDNRARGLGSGFVIDSQGFVATNAHVVTMGEQPPLKRADSVWVEFGDGNRVPARIIGDDPNADVALLKLDPEGLDLTPLKLGSTQGLRVGDPVAAIGSPFGERRSLSVGVISAIDRNIQSLNAQYSIGDALQTDAAINQGNSGGPLLDQKGEVIGINSQIKSSSGGGEGVGFAVNVSTVKRSVEQLRTTGRVEYGYLGVSSAALYPQLAEFLDVDAESGAVVGRVEPGSPAEKAGIEPGDEETEFQGQPVTRGGDVIVAVNGRPLAQQVDLADAVSVERPGELVKLEVLRDGRRRTVEVRLGERPVRRPSGG